jgi:hypothetical protein
MIPPFRGISASIKAGTVRCNDALDILPALGLAVRDLFDKPGAPNGYQPNPAVQARIEARRNMNQVQRAVDDLLHLPDLGERLCRAIAWHETVEGRWPE